MRHSVVVLNLLLLLTLGGCSTTKGTAKAVYSGTVLGVQGLYYTGKGIYMVGKIPVIIVDKALDVTNETLRLTHKIVNTAGEVATYSKVIAAKSLEAELAALKKIPDIVEIIVDVAN